MSVKALKEVKEDRLIRQKPHLAFEGGGYRLSIKFVKVGRRVPGIDPDFANKLFSHFPEEIESIQLQDIKDNSEQLNPQFYGQLKNFGLGPALETEITWIPSSVRIGSETFIIDEAKLDEPIYSCSLNTLPAWPQNIIPGGIAELSRLPTFIDKDFEKKYPKLKEF